MSVLFKLKAHLTSECLKGRLVRGEQRSIRLYKLVGQFARAVLRQYNLVRIAVSLQNRSCIR
jgi:hypothetical protein